MICKQCHSNCECCLLPKVNEFIDIQKICKKQRQPMKPILNWTKFRWFSVVLELLVAKISFYIDFLSKKKFFEWLLDFPETTQSSSLTLQILLFINVYLVPIWMISSLQFFYVHTFDEAGRHNQIVLGAALFLIAAPLEICRLYLGYSGNLRERVRLIFFRI